MAAASALPFLDNPLKICDFRRAGASIRARSGP
jgi:hypothetical protein